jgi:tight adherence protein B
MSEYLAQFTGLLGALSVVFAVGGYAVVLQRRHFEARLSAYVGGNAPVRHVVDRSPRLTQRRLSLRCWPIGADPIQLVRAGVSLTTRKFLCIQLATAGFGLLLAWVLGRLAGLTSVSLVLGLLFGLVLGVFVPHLVLRLKRRRRFIKFESQFANALDSLANAAEVGLSVSQALENISRDLPAPVGPEFQQVLRGLGMGLPLTEALDQLAYRVPQRDVELFVAAVSIQHRTGGGVSQILHKIASTVRERVNMRSEIRALTAQQRFSAYLISALPIVIAMIIKFVSPKYFDMLLQPGMMRILVFAAVAGIVAGFYFMMRIADIEV